jgi:hypothetical protein
VERAARHENRGPKSGGVSPKSPTKSPVRTLPTARRPASQFDLLEDADRQPAHGDREIHRAPTSGRAIALIGVQIPDGKLHAGSKYSG